jgi:hypothetical protein
MSYNFSSMNFQSWTMIKYIKYVVFFAGQFFAAQRLTAPWPRWMRRRGKEVAHHRRGGWRGSKARAPAARRGFGDRCKASHGGATEERRGAWAASSREDRRGSRRIRWLSSVGAAHGGARQQGASSRRRGAAPATATKLHTEVWQMSSAALGWRR